MIVSLIETHQVELRQIQSQLFELCERRKELLMILGTLQAANRPSPTPAPHPDPEPA